MTEVASASTYNLKLRITAKGVRPISDSQQVVSVKKNVQQIKANGIGNKTVKPEATKTTDKPPPCKRKPEAPLLLDDGQRGKRPKNEQPIKIGDKPPPPCKRKPSEAPLLLDDGQRPKKMTLGTIKHKLDQAKQMKNDDNEKGGDFVRENNNNNNNNNNFRAVAKQAAVSSSHNKETTKSVKPKNEGGIGDCLVEHVRCHLAPKPPPPPCKRKPSEAPLLERGKRPKKMILDRVLKIQCGALLNEVMSHRGFAEPKLKSPLGATKQKLEGNVYSNADEFAQDVKLAFKNATFFYPVGHTVREYAKEMNSIFCRGWRLLDQAKQMKNDDDEKGGDFVRENNNNFRAVAKQAAVSSSHNKETTKSAARVAQKPAAVQKKQSAYCPRVVDRKKSVGVAQAKCPSSCASSLACHCRQKKAAAACAPQAISMSSGLSSERSSENNHHSGSGVPNRRGSSQETTDGPAAEAWSSLNAQISPSKALRAAKLKTRFADLILRATHQTAAKSDPTRKREESERLEREKQQEKARFVAETKAAEAASRLKEQNDLKKKRERQRASAKRAFQEMERSVDLNGSLDIVNDVEMLSKATWLYKSLGIPNNDLI